MEEPDGLDCNVRFSIPANSNNGSRLQGNGFGSANRLNGGDTFGRRDLGWKQPPNSLNGYFIFSPAESAGTTQPPSPFFNGSNYLCFQEQFANNERERPAVLVHTFTVPTGAAVATTS
jgi:hypothetical protein